MDPALYREKLSECMKNKEAYANIRNKDDNECFNWAMLIDIHITHNEQKAVKNQPPFHYQQYKDESNFSEINFTVGLKNVAKFGEKKDISQLMCIVEIIMEPSDSN